MKSLNLSRFSYKSGRELQENVEESPEGEKFDVPESEKILVQSDHEVQENEENPGEKFDDLASEKMSHAR